MFAVAELEQTSVTSEVIRQTMVRMIQSGREDRDDSPSPIQEERPDSVDALAIANPAPLIISSPQGKKFVTVDQSKRAGGRTT